MFKSVERVIKCVGWISSAVWVAYDYWMNLRVMLNEWLIVYTLVLVKNFKDFMF